MREGQLKLTSGFGLSYCGDGDGEDAGDDCTDASGVAIGEGLAGKGEAPAGEFSLNEGGTCINESKESLAGVGVGEVAFSCAGPRCGFDGVASASEGAFDRGSEMSLRPFFFASATGDASSNLPCTIVPDLRLETT